MKNLTNKIFKIILSLTVFALVFGNTLNVLAQTTNGLDIFYITSPIPNQSVKGSISVSWRMYDDEQESIQYSAKVYDRETCETTNYGNITSNSNGLSSKTADNVLIWDTRSTDTNPNLSDGFYCLQICLALIDNGIPYTSCNGREVLIVNNNRAPVISSLPPSDNEILETESWQYQLNASDPDNQNLSYRLIVKPSFLDINPTNGLISTNSSSKALASGVYRAEYRVVVEVRDTFNAISTQEFKIVVYKPLPQNNNNGGTPSEDLDEDELNEASIINISSPKTNSNLSGKQNLIKWNISDSDGISSIEIEYSLDEKEWINITKITDNDTQSIGEYTWDVSDITDGKYFLRFKVTDSENSISEEVISNINIKNNEDITSQPIIYELRPENSSEITELRPEISAKFIASTGNSIDTETFTISLNDNDILDQCSLTGEGFVCKLSRDLTLGKHKLKASVSDTSEKTTDQEWYFDIVSSSTPNENIDNSNTFNLFGRDIPIDSLVTLLLICLLAMLLLLIPWAIFLIIKNRRNRVDRVNIDITNTPKEPLPVPELGNTPSAEDIQKVFMPESVIQTDTPQTQDSTPVDLNVTEFQEPAKTEESEVKKDDSSTEEKNIDISSFEEFLKQYPELSKPSEPAVDQPSDRDTTPLDVNVNINNNVEPQKVVQPEETPVVKEDTPTITPEVQEEFVEPEVIDNNTSNTNTPQAPIPEANTYSQPSNIAEPVVEDWAPVSIPNVVTPKPMDVNIENNVNLTQSPTVEESNQKTEENVAQPITSDIPKEVENNQEVKKTEEIIEPSPTPVEPEVITPETKEQSEPSIEAEIKPVVGETNAEVKVEDKQELYKPVQFDTLKPQESSTNDKTKTEDILPRFNPNSTNWAEFYENQQKAKEDTTTNDNEDKSDTEDKL